MNGFNVLRVIFHVVGEDKGLRNIDELSEFLVFEADIDAISFRKDAFAVVGFLHLYKCKRHSVYQKGNIRAKFIITVFAGKFCDYME